MRATSTRSAKGSIKQACFAKVEAEQEANVARIKELSAALAAPEGVPLVTNETALLQARDNATDELLRLERVDLLRQAQDDRPHSAGESRRA